MKTGMRIGLLICACVTGVLLLACESQSDGADTAQTAQAVQTQSVKVKVDGMSCGGCAATIEAALAANQGVTKKSVDLVEGCCEVEYNPAQTNREEIVSTIEKAGYKASVAE